MKKVLYLLTFLCLFSFSSFAQDGEPGGGKLRAKMAEYIANKLNLSKDEADKFAPVFLDYLRDQQKTMQENRGDKLVLQQKIVELRLRYRDQFKPLIGEKRSNDVFTHARDFVQEAKELREDRLQNRRDGRANKRF